MAEYKCNPIPKKHSRPQPKNTFPVIIDKGNVHKFSGEFNGFCVEIRKEDDMKNIVSMGCFGKAKFSRSYPRHNNTVIRNRVLENRKKIQKNIEYKDKLNKIVVVPDSDSENEDYFTNLNPKYEIDNSGICESVSLCLEESFFLAHVVKCLTITFNKNILSVEELWTLFLDTEPTFSINYAVYIFYRSKNWIVKPGIKYGSDYLLYKQGPAFFHASYVIKIIPVYETNFILDNKTVYGLNRLCEAAAKELIIAQVFIQSPISGINLSNLSNLKIKEILVKRWMLAQQREADD